MGRYRRLLDLDLSGIRGRDLMRRRDKLHPLHPNYNETRDHYVIRVGLVTCWEFNMPYPLPTGFPQVRGSAMLAFAKMISMIKSEKSDRDEAVKLVLVLRKAGTPRASGRMRFYEKELMEWTSVGLNVPGEA